MWANQESAGRSVALGGEGRWVPPQWCRARRCAACESPRWILAALIAALGWTPAGRLAAQTLTTLHAFSALGSTNADGANPLAGLILSGNTLYGTAQNGGILTSGAVFRLNIDGTGFTNLHSFSGGSDGANPQAALVLSGNTLYGTARTGGNSGAGTVFSVNTDGTGFKTLHGFSQVLPLRSNADGAYPQAGLVLSGNTLYGTASVGGSFGGGTVFSVSTDGTGFANLHSFAGGSDGYFPVGALVLSGDALYGTAAYGGSGGTVFSLSTDGTGFTSLHSFGGGSDGAYPSAGLFLSGNALYGTASAGGSSGTGTVFSVNTDGTGFTNLHNFSGGSDGASPSAGLTLAGNTLYGTAFAGGSSGNGTVFSVNADGTGFTALHGFSQVAPRNTDGANPSAALTLSGNTLYGTASAGGSSGCGTVFRVNRDGTGFTTLHAFNGGSDGANPQAGLVLSGDTLYGTAAYGGDASGRSGGGTVFSVKTDGTRFATLHTFNGVNDGAWPYAGLILSANTLYGTATASSISGGGAVFGLNTDGTGFTNLPILAGGDGQLVLSANTLYGTALGGSPAGTVFSVNTDGTGFMALCLFGQAFDPAEPFGGLVLSGNTLYGTSTLGGRPFSEGTVFSVNTDGTQLATLHSFTGGSEGAHPYAGLLLLGNTLYGTTDPAYFGDPGNGTVYSVNTDGTGFKTLYRFTGGSDGANPYAGLTLSGNTLYGTASGGGTWGNGTVFSLLLPPQLAVIRSGTNVILTWPTNAAGFALQFTTSLVSPATWTTISLGPAVVNGLNTVTNPITGAQQFYRLSQ